MEASKTTISLYGIDIDVLETIEREAKRQQRRRLAQIRVILEREAQRIKRSEQLALRELRGELTPEYVPMSEAE